ncbi:secreted protease [[Actinomadura] parvosata subsp. kistnae]|uniref:Signal protein PDZ n=1 Tax=[Actinomadura] parvosata subsp. kistnae TaxID=1909395 RepID=A0A1V0A8J2_9ACTN|nr:trypsin-like peptidase domain-containing protein [Nonomuraea sp. ATCC 55076]AQZ66520.1 signal protein PDZ [Nonomuraea sp. ATCC 55076]SPL95410.1 secreted protease [Actinomadura parvosata subsp. kistnae]
MREIAAGLAAAAVLVAGCGPPPTTTGTVSPSAPPSTTTAPPSTPSTTAASPTSSPQALEAAYEKVISDVLPSIVQITTKVGLGSGIVFDTQGHIVTNAHVVGQATQMNVTIATGGPPRSARLVKSFAGGDLAVIKVDRPDGLKPARFGDSSKLRVGQIVLAMGNPLGLSGSVTNGIVSALGRTVTEPQNPDSPGATIAGAIQTSAAINPGNSGGALVDLSGHVIGIPTLAATDPDLGGGAAPGIGFAIPSNTATDIARQIVKDGRVTNSHRAALGIRGSTVIGSDGQPSGVGVASVDRGSGAEKAGIRAGDVIVSINGKDTTTMALLAETITTLKPGDHARVGVIRSNGRTETLNVTLGQLPGE